MEILYHYEFFDAFFIEILYRHDYFYCILFIHPVSSWLFLLESFYTSCIIIIIFNPLFLDILYYYDYF